MRVNLKDYGAEPATVIGYREFENLVKFVYGIDYDFCQAMEIACYTPVNNDSCYRFKVSCGSNVELPPVHALASPLDVIDNMWIDFYIEPGVYVIEVSW